MSATAQPAPPTALGRGQIALCEFCASRFSLPNTKISGRLPEEAQTECCICYRPRATLVFGGEEAGRSKG